MELSKYFTGEVATVRRSEIHFASYNPRIIDEENRKNLKRGIKRYGILGGIVVNKRTGMTIVGGHQKVNILDDLHKYNPQTKENDYWLRVELVDVDEKTEMEENVLLNNPNAQGRWDRNKLAKIIPDIEYKDAGLSEADLSLLGLDYMFKTEEQSDLTSSLGDLMKEVNDEKDAEKAQREAEKQAERAAKVAHMKEVKAQVKQASEKSAGDMEAYVMLSFDNIESKNRFLQRFGYEPDKKFIKGEDFDMRCEVINEE